MDSVCSHDVEKLLRLFSKRAYDATDSNDLIQDIQKKCEDLFAKDYNYRVINNIHGELLTTYPSRILLLEGEKSGNTLDGSENQSSDESRKLYDLPKLRNLIVKAKCARVRGRFPVPVILYEGKNICRSATVATSLEVLSVKSTEYISQIASSVFSAASEISQAVFYDNDDDNNEQPGTFPLFDSRNDDIRLLKALSVSHICDLMVEKKKKKFGCYMASSEKIDKENRYNDFTLWSLPYPGCEFFKDYRDKKYRAEELVFNWDQDYVDASLYVPSESLVSKLGIDFNNYKIWDLVTLTQNYMKLIVTFLIEGTSGILVHCISGWDRTPLFISLLRMSLWADGKIHSSLTALEMLYLTLAYDWYLFKHKLPERFSQGEEIMHFCFHFIRYLIGEEYSVVRRQEVKAVSFPDPQLEVLLEESSLPVHGSITSLSSDNSSLSNRSHDNHPAVLSQLDSSDESSSCNYQNMSPLSKDSANFFVDVDSVVDSSSTLTLSSRNGSHLSLNGNFHSGIGSINLIKSSPVAVPNDRQRTESMSSGCGSWQIIRESESLRSFGAFPEVNQNFEDPTLSQGFEASQSAKSSRQEKLHHIEVLFHNVYSSVMGKR